MAPPRSLPGLPEDYTSRFFVGDIVTKKTDPAYRGKIMRAWADEEGDLPPVLPGEARHPLDRALLRGEVGMSDTLTSDPAIVPESDLELVSREFLKGDTVKHALTDVESAVVMDVLVECQLEHVISGQRLRDWVDYKKLRTAFQIEARDKVVYDEWIGTVEEVMEDGLVETQRGDIYRIAEMGGLLEPGRVAKDILPFDDPFSHTHHIGSMPPSARLDRDRVVQVRPLGLYVTWNAINQELPITEQDKHPQPKPFWSGKEIEQLTLFDGTKGTAPPLNTTVNFVDPADEQRYGVKATTHGRGSIRLATCKVVESRCRLKLRWQDGAETEEWSAGFVPYRNLDDYESWPGEHLVWRDDDGVRHPAVVQSFNPHQRVVDLFFPASQERQTVSVLDIDVGGFGKADYGVGVGQHVLFTPDNGAPPPEVPALGQTDPHIDRDVWRVELDKLQTAYLARPDAYGAYAPQGSTAAVEWWGEVVDLHTDGTASVELYHGKVRRVDIRQLVVLNEPGSDALLDGLLDDDGGSESMATDASWETLSDGGDGIVVDDDEDGMGGQGDDGPGDESQADAWSSPVVHDIVLGDPTAAGDPIDSLQHGDEDDEDARDVETVEPMVLDDDVDAVVQPESSTAASGDSATTAAAAAVGHARAAPLATAGEAGPSSAPAGAAAPRPSLADDDDKWQRFAVLEAAPAEHHFASEALGAPSRTFHSRVAKEHRALASSLPENILVRTYEDRTDLVRVLIIGPEGTPYNDAPFVFDVYLNPTKFPFEPPQVFFHSHTNGHGRCNPNLYEDGKVCLSILGTWSGDASESWNPGKSSLLQVFVSISGLVLTRSPYHCEPAFAKLEGTREGRVNSRLYSEKAYVLSRSFVKTALQHPPAGFGDEIRHFYFTRGRLASVIAHAQALISKGEAAVQASGSGSAADGDEENAEMWNADAMGSLTMGAILTLKRTVAVLVKIEKEEAETK